MRNKYTDLQNPEELCGAEANNSLSMSVLSEEMSNTSLSLNDCIVYADSPVKTEIEKNNKYSRLEKEASFDD